MSYWLILIYYTVVLTALIVGMAKYRQLDKAMQVVVLLLLLTAIGEMLSYITSEMKAYFIRNRIFHVDCIIEIFLISLFFIYAIKPKHYRKLIVLTVIVWPTMGILNIFLLQSFDTFNENMLMLESFSTITMSLYFIYWLLKNDRVKNIFAYPHFWVAILWLLMWSITFFFWAFVRVLYSERWPYIDTAMHIQAIVNIVAYAGIAAVLILYPKNLKAYEDI